MTRNRIREDVLRCIQIGLFIAGLYSVFVVGVYLVEGPARFEASGVTLPAVLAVYFTGAIVGGAVTGLLLPLAKTRAGSTFVGIVAALPIGVGGFTAIEGYNALADHGTWISIVIFAIGLGGLTGFLWRTVHS